jgi:hypothetical protein
MENVKARVNLKEFVFSSRLKRREERRLEVVGRPVRFISRVVSLPGAGPEK